MKFDLMFEQISDLATCSITMNSITLYEGKVLPTHSFETDGGCLEIHSSNHEIFELKHVTIDNQSLDEVLWNTAYFTNGTETRLGGLCFNSPGKIVLEVTSPFNEWLTVEKHKRYKTDPMFAEDFAYYEKACQLLAQIQN
jgi:hypothetical protein